MYAKTHVRTTWWQTSIVESLFYRRETLYNCLLPGALPLDPFHFSFLNLHSHGDYPKKPLCQQVCSLKYCPGMPLVLTANCHRLRFKLTKTLNVSIVNIPHAWDEEIGKSLLSQLVPVHLPLQKKIENKTV